jgi:hypothetical protein
MTDLTSFDLADGLQVTVEAPGQPGVTPAGLRPRVAHAEQTLEHALRPVTAAAAEVLQKFRNLPGRPDEIEIHFGIRLDATFGAIIASTTVGTNLDVTLRWSHATADAADGAGDPGRTAAAPAADGADGPDGAAKPPGVPSPS